MLGTVFFRAHLKLPLFQYYPPNYKTHSEAGNQEETGRRYTENRLGTNYIQDRTNIRIKEQNDFVPFSPALQTELRYLPGIRL